MTAAPANAPTDAPVRIGVLTSGGDAQGMNAAVRAVVRAALRMGAQPYAVMEGWAGAVAGGDSIRPLNWDSVGSILHRGGTVIGTARSAEFRERDGQLAAARNLLEHDIDRLVVIGGDGSLTGTDAFRTNWPGLVAELAERGEISPEKAAAHPALMVTGLVGSIDNDLVGADMTIGTDSALHRILEAIDDISSTAASHQRTFIIEVMGRHCGYLALMAAVAGGCDYVLVPELPPAGGWEEDMCRKLAKGREAGRRESMVVVAEGATDRSGNPISADDVKRVLSERLGEDARVTILGHVQRGGKPSAYDRWMSTLLGCAAAHEAVTATPESEPVIIAERHNRISRLPMMEQIRATRAVKDLVASGDYEGAVAARGASFGEMLRIFETMSTPPELDPDAASDQSPSAESKRVAIIHAGGLAPGMNTAARAAVRLGLDHDFTMLGVYGGFPGLLDGDVRELSWDDVEGWVGDGGAELGTRREIPTIEQLYSLGRAIESHRIDALLIIGGFNAYLSAYELVSERDRYPAFKIPIICVPASIDNNLPGSELSIGADTALNNAVGALDSIKQSAAASHRCFVAESMGRKCGYLALMSGIATGAERVYLNEDGLTLAQLAQDSARMVDSFRSGRQLYLVIRNERASKNYTLDVLAKIFSQEGHGLYDVRHAAIGHLQQGGDPSAFDRIMATKLVAHALDLLAEQLEAGTYHSSYVGLTGGRISHHRLERMNDELDLASRRPLHQWWMGLREAISLVSQNSGVIPMEDIPDFGAAVSAAAAPSE
ncbi:6-phosphofructokinase [Actinomyces massiliensis]|uniref:6-phosphofructokinase n=1 Tax=Actinomyces massiliensis F0489 TaxID=1125718 RepID=J0N1S5_9ACTO|nr:6-phosphofructokinase [Actinomyces massiliensis]EJF38317.1 6-phosphofructokinase [Actinomyces massiliensis F0489]WLD70851.1 6-phosphofructokinase [Actinomyces massiliensis]